MSPFVALVLLVFFLALATTGDAVQTARMTFKTRLHGGSSHGGQTTQEFTIDDRGQSHVSERSDDDAACANAWNLQKCTKQLDRGKCRNRKVRKMCKETCGVCAKVAARKAKAAAKKAAAEKAAAKQAAADKAAVEKAAADCSKYKGSSTVSASSDCMQNNCGWVITPDAPDATDGGYCVSCGSTRWVAVLGKDSSWNSCMDSRGVLVDGCLWTGSECRAANSIFIGGETHSNFRQLRYRPEEMRAELCNEGNCGECDKPEECWQGSRGGTMEVKIPSNSPGERRFTTWTKCFTAEGGGYLRINTRIKINRRELNPPVSQNGVLTVSLNGNEVFHATGAADVVTLDGEHLKNISPLPVGDLKIVVSFTPKDITKSSQAFIEVYLGNQDPFADDCLAHKFCLDQWGDGTRGSFRLRNENDKQRDCLRGMPMPPEMEPQCEAWKACLALRGSTDFEESLLHMADAAFSGATETETVTAPDSCVDPRIADAEVFGCECLNELKSQCGATSDQTTCYKDLFCGHCKVCFKWKQEHCSSTQVADHQANCAQLLQPDAIANETALLRRSAGHRTAAHATAAQVSSSIDRDHKLDASVAAKCGD